MLRLPTLAFKQAYLKLLSPHIAKILEEDSNSPSPKYALCKNYIESLGSSCSDESKIKANMLFNASCSSEALQHLKPQISQMIIGNQIKNQYELDQIVKWLLRQVKINNKVSKQDILHKLARRDQELSQFEQQLQILSENKQKHDTNMLCKQFRNKYFTLDSKTIFDKVNNCLQSMVKSKREVKLWEKLATIKPRTIKQECNSKQVHQQHLRITQGRLRFRFPPQPNGPLHLGHAKAIRLNFQSALQTKGTCYLRYDDTNPEKESKKFIEDIQSDVRWLGYTPDKITFASDYFQQIMHYANQLIKMGKAYVCDSSRPQIQLQRKEKRANPYRKRPIVQSLKMFPNLQPNQTLRLMGNPAHSNPTLRDPVIYRLKDHHHPRTGDKYKVYPTYDFTHCLCDSIEHIDYSFCSLEFEVRRELYYIFLDLLGLYKPTVWQFSRLNVQGALLSKRKILQMVEGGQVSGWDDPRLLTLQGLKSRGYTAQVINRFVERVNSSRSGNENTIQYSLLQRQMRKSLSLSPKTMAVLQPVQATIKTQNKHILLQKEEIENVLVGSRIVVKTKGLYQVESTDPLILNKFNVDNVSLYIKNNPNTSILNWVDKSTCKNIRVTLFDSLIDEEINFNPRSKLEYDNAKISEGADLSWPYIQLDRIGYFRVVNKQQLQLCVKM